MAGSRTLKLSILADVDDLRKKLDQSTNEVQTFGDKVTNFGKVAGAAFLAAGAAAGVYAGKLAIEGVKAAIEDEAAQTRLANTLKNVTNATEDQIKATEAYILKTSLANGVTDEELRPSLERLTRATKDVKEAQYLQSLALDIAAGSGKSLEAVSNALGKAYEGNTAALGKLGIGISAAQLKTLTFDEITKQLGDTFENQASVKAQTFQGKLDRLRVAFDEGKETVGGYILTAITPLVESLVNKVIPAVADFTSNLGDKLQPVIKIITPIINGLKSAFSTVSDSLKENQDELQPLFNLFKAFATFVVEILAPAVGTTLGLAFKALGKILDGLIDTLASVVNFFTNLFNKIKAVIDLIGKIPSSVGGFIGRSSFETPSDAGTSNFNNAGLGGDTYINVTGAVDPESTARQIIDLLNTSSYRGTLGASALV